MSTIDKAIERIKKAGFSHIKVELEADMGRNCGGDSECGSCEGDGREDCEDCGGEGFYDTQQTTRLSGETVYAECESCCGDGDYECSNCDGEGVVEGGDFSSESYCEDFMKEHVSPEVLSRLTYGRFYEDGSVDSEFTFTVPIEHARDVIDWTKAFVELSEQCDGLDVGGAGLHIAVLPKESNGSYPVARNTMPSHKVNNFTSEMTKLLPALFFLASSNTQSRGLSYRTPQIHSEKYSAISHHDRSCFEFRVFETCYGKPETFFDYLQTIANCLEFYANPNLKVKAIGKSFGFNEENRLVSRFYSTPEQLKILNSTIKYLKPKDKTIKQLKKERGMDYTVTEVKKKNRDKIANLKSEYYEYKRRWLQDFHRPLTPRQEAMVAQYVREDGIDREQAILYAKDCSRLTNLEEFLMNNINNRNYTTVSV